MRIFNSFKKNPVDNKITENVVGALMPTNDYTLEDVVAVIDEGDQFEDSRAELRSCGHNLVILLFINTSML
jgi:hypothetical protein